MNTVRTIAAFILGVVATPLLIVICAHFGWFSVPAVDNPPKWEERIGSRALDMALARRARGMKSPIPDNDETLLAGLKLYRNNCAGCHGDFASPSRWGSKNFYPRVPQFSVQPPDLLTTEMFLAVKYGVRYSGMGAWNGLLPDEDIWRVSLFLAHLPALPPAVDAAWRKQESGGT